MAPMIRCMFSDVSKHVRENVMQHRILSNSTATDAPCNLEMIHDKTLAQIDAMVDHNCGDYSHCSTRDYLCLRLQNHYFAKYCAEH